MFDQVRWITRKKGECRHFKTNQPEKHCQLLTNFRPKTASISKLSQPFCCSQLRTMRRDLGSTIPATIFISAAEVLLLALQRLRHRELQWGEKKDFGQPTEQNPKEKLQEVVRYLEYTLDFDAIDGFCWRWCHFCPLKKNYHIMFLFCCALGKSR